MCPACGTARAGWNMCYDCSAKEEGGVKDAKGFSS